MTAMTLPTRLSAYKLIPAGMFYETRRKPVLGIVLHITAGLQDLGLVGTDESAEGTIGWALREKPQVSWHAIGDTDGVELCIPDWFTAFHAKDYNSPTVGIEISKLNTDWTKVSAKWIEATLRPVARYAAAIVDKYSLPLLLATKAQVDSAVAANRKFGFTYHSRLSSIRSDPGANFPWEKFVAMVREELAPPPPPPPPPPSPSIGEDMLAYQMTGHADPAVAAVVVLTDGWRMRALTGVGKTRINGGYKFQHGEDLFVTAVKDLVGLGFEWYGPLPTPDFPLPPGTRVIPQPEATA